MIMPDRKYNGPNYRFGFNGKESDNEVKGFWNELDYGLRISDPRLGRFLSLDPLIKKYPELTPYQFASNRPIDGTDIDGSEFNQELFSWLVKTNPKTGQTNAQDVWNGAKERAIDTY